MSLSCWPLFYFQFSPQYHNTSSTVPQTSDRGCVTCVLWWGVGWKNKQEPAFQPLFPIIPLTHHIFALKMDVQNVTYMWRGLDGSDTIRWMEWSSKSKCSLSQFGEYQAKCDEKKMPKNDECAWRKGKEKLSKTNTSRFEKKHVLDIQYPYLSTILCFFVCSNSDFRLRLPATVY